MELYATPQPLSFYLNQEFSCTCGRTHKAALQQVHIGSRALEELPRFVKTSGFRRLFLVSDPITYQAAGKQCEALLSQAKISYQMAQLQHLGFDEATLGELLIKMPADCDLCVAVGSGTVNDITRFLSYKTGRPFMTVATAPSMDGYASSVAALHANHLKVTLDAHTPLAIIGDTEILRNAPYGMIAAGLGDLLGKFTCLCDWKISRIVNGEHQCDQIVALMESNVEHVLQNAHKAKDRDPEVIGSIMNGLVLAGVAMSLYGNSRPASGCEHHTSHFWEMLFEQRGMTPALHGTQVGVGTVLMLKLAEKLLAAPLDFAAARRAAAAYDANTWKQQIRSVYGPAAEGIIAIEASAQKNAIPGRLTRIDAIEKNWPQICSHLKALPASETVAELLRSLSSPALPQEIGVDAALMKHTFLYCKEVRNRYTMLQMLWDLNLLDKLSDEIIQEIYEGENIT